MKRGEGVSWFDALGKVADHPGVVGVGLAARAQGALDVLERQWAALHATTGATTTTLSVCDCLPGSLVPCGLKRCPTRHKRH